MSNSIIIIGSWEDFMSEYSKRHPTLVDETITRAVFDSLPPSSPTESNKRGRTIADEGPAEAKKPRCVRLIPSCRNMWLTCPSECGPIEQTLSYMYLCVHLSMSVVCFFFTFVHRVESGSVERREDTPVTVLFTGISQSVVKSLKQVYTFVRGSYKYMQRLCTA